MVRLSLHDESMPPEPTTATPIMTLDPKRGNFKVVGRDRSRLVMFVMPRMKKLESVFKPDFTDMVL